WSGLVRWARRRRLAVAAAALTLVVATVTTTTIWMAAQIPLQERARAKLAQLWDDAESKAFRFQYFGRWRRIDADAPEEAFRHLAAYQVLGAPDWRASSEFRALSGFDRQELEIWLLEQALRF